MKIFIQVIAILVVGTLLGIVRYVLEQRRK